MIKLRNKPTLYLSGAVQRAKDPWTWRFALRDALSKEYDVIIPEDKLDLPSNATMHQKQQLIKNDIVIKDVKDVVDCSEFFVKIDPDVFKGAGTVSEVTFAAYFNKPMVYVLDKIKLKKLPNWVQGCLFNALLVKDIDQAIKHFLAKARSLR
jgi:predicted transcriptional regulator